MLYPYFCHLKLEDRIKIHTTHEPHANRDEAFMWKFKMRLIDE